MIKKLESVVFFIFILSLPIQLGKHFWPSFAYVAGIRIDYLSPTLYVSDCLILCLLGFFVISFIRKPYFSISKTQSIICCGIIFDILIPFLVISHSLAILYGLVKVLEFICIGWFISRYFSLYWKQFLWASLINVLWVSFLTFAEFILQRSVGNIFYFVGERIFSSSTPGIATFPWNGEQILRPYATFPHPNVLAFFLLFSLLYLLFNFHFFHTSRTRILAAVAVFFGSIALFLTFSRILLIAYSISCLLFVYTKSIEMKWKQYFLGLLLSFVVIMGIISARFSYQSLSRDFALRQSLIPLTFSIIEKSPLWGIGLNRYYVYEIGYQKNISPTFLQPVHNIFLLLTAEMGIVGLFLIGIFLSKTFHHLWIVPKKNSNPYFFLPTIFLLIIIMCAGLFDHYFITLQQGQIITTLVIGVAWSRFMG